jgi:hypothetical protein
VLGPHPWWPLLLIGGSEGTWAGSAAAQDAPVDGARDALAAQEFPEICSQLVNHIMINGVVSPE